MPTLVLTVIGDDRAGLVNALAEVVSANGGNWERSELAELAGKFAGIVVVTVASEAADALVAALRPLSGLLDITVHEAVAEPDAAPPAEVVTIELLGNDSPGIVREVSGVLARHGVSIERLTSDTVDAPMAGGRLFQARLVAPVAPGQDLAALLADLERLAAELMVDLTLDRP